eukprot:1972675-Pyramimonas_sp.AAC.1
MAIFCSPPPSPSRDPSPPQQAEVPSSSQPEEEPTPKYRCWDDVPWWEKTFLNVGAAIEWPGQQLTGLVGLDKYYPSMFKDTKDKLKHECDKGGGSDGWDWETFGRGIGEVKVLTALTGGDPGNPDPAEAATSSAEDPSRKQKQVPREAAPQ